MRKLAWVLLCAFIFSCTSDKKKETVKEQTPVQNTVADSLTYTYDSVKVYSKTPVSPNKNVTDTAKAVIVFPLFKDTTLNSMLVNKVGFTSTNGDKQDFRTYREIATAFMERFDSYEDDNDDHHQTWFSDIKMHVLLQRPGFISLQLNNIYYLGGAHPNSMYLYLNYDLKTHKVVKLEPLLKPGSMPKLNAIAEKIFRKNEGLAPTAPLTNGYFFEKDTFKLNDNFTITTTGLQFLYNPYEIKPYVSGRTVLTIPFSEIKDMIKENSLLSTFL
jgi:hypothetical protein